jgi:hypothetical protein
MRSTRNTGIGGGKRRGIGCQGDGGDRWSFQLVADDELSRNVLGVGRAPPVAEQEQLAAAAQGCFDDLEGRRKRAREHRGERIEHQPMLRQLDMHQALHVAVGGRDSSQLVQHNPGRPLDMDPRRYQPSIAVALRHIAAE